MPTEVKKQIQLEIAHVLFTDIVGYSKLPINEQRALVERLNEIVRSTDEFHAAEAAGRLIKIPTGDGITLVFYHSPEAPVECALEISRALKKYPELQLRMGIHSGPVSGVIDVTGKANVSGAGINMAQRVMDCGDAGHILLSKHVAEDLEQYPHWQPHLHELGECEVKHGVRVSVVNLYTEELGNPAVPEKLKAARVAAAAGRRRAAFRWISLGVLALLLAMLVISFLLKRTKRPSAAAGLAIPEKSIAVLPFENLSENKENAFFADGVQDEILTDLARIADLKVISRTSVIGYRDTAGRNLRKVGQELGVAHLLEGSVQRAGNRVRVNAQLVDARTDAHLWAQTYDRDLADVFAIQSEIAKAIADQLQAKLSPREKAEIETAPTSNVAAFDLYTRAKALLARGTYTTAFGYATQAVELLNHAIAIDPNFFLAYCQLEFVHDNLYLQGRDRTPARRALGEAAVQAAIRLRPDAGETHLAIAGHLYRVDLNYNGARIELEKAKATLPNDPQVYELTGYIDRRQGRWEDSIRHHRKALELDPRNYYLYQQISLTYSQLRRFPEMASALDRALEILPDDAETRAARASVDLLWHGDTGPLNNTIRDIVAKDPAAATSIAELWFYNAMCRRDPADAERAVAAIPSWGIAQNGVIFPHALSEAEVARFHGDERVAREAFTRARTELEAKLRVSPDHGPTLAALGLIDAGLGRKEDAIREGRRAAELTPISKESIAGSGIIETLALIYAWIGEKDLALEQLAISALTPAGVTYGQLKLNPIWDPLRDDRRFEKIVEESKQPVAPK
jgi:TolB-like protein/class 3 adenylate cyclase/Flp pilus assembly protein TadD